ncbi:MAG TPA: hypothetical protein VMM38_01280 [Aridibacter sp.]|nr:hypothetical protein [Aridibacter sp.]
MAKITVEISALEELELELAKLATEITGELGKRAYQLMRKEVPYKTGELKQGIVAYLPGGRTIGTGASTSGRPVSKPNRAEVVASGRRARRGPRSATLHLKSGKTKQITLRSRDSYNYASAVAEGRKAITPKKGKAILIPVANAPADESYIVEGDQIYVVRKSAKAYGGNPFHERAAKRLEREAVMIVEAVAEDLFGG